MFIESELFILCGQRLKLVYSGGARGEWHLSSIYIIFATAKFSQVKFSLKSNFSMALLMIKMTDEVLNENISYVNLLQGPHRFLSVSPRLS